jgi:hypothetical protein
MVVTLIVDVYGSVALARAKQLIICVDRNSIFFFPFLDNDKP